MVRVVKQRERMEVKCLHIHLERLRVRYFEREIEKCGTTRLEREREIHSNRDWGLREKER